MRIFVYIFFLNFRALFVYCTGRNVAIDIYARVSLRIRQVSIVIHWMFCYSEQLYSGIDLPLTTGYCVGEEGGEA